MLYVLERRWEETIALQHQWDNPFIPTHAWNNRAHHANAIVAYVTTPPSLSSSISPEFSHYNLVELLAPLENISDEEEAVLAGVEDPRIMEQEGTAEDNIVADALRGDGSDSDDDIEGGHDITPALPYVPLHWLQLSWSKQSVPVRLFYVEFIIFLIFSSS